MGEKPTYEELEQRIKELERKITLSGFHKNHEPSVEVPNEFRSLFDQAERIVCEYFNQITIDPSKGRIEIGNERYVLVRASALSIDFLKTVADLYKDRGEDEAFKIGKDILFDLAHVIGKEDAKAFHKKMGLEDPIAKLSVGPVHFAHSGWAKVNIAPESIPSADNNFFLKYDHPFSFEADAWLRAGQHSNSPVCIMNTGYSSGWCEESFSLSLTAVEIACRAKGDDNCTFIMAPPNRIEEHLQNYLMELPEHIKKKVVFDIPSFFERESAAAERIFLERQFQQAQKMEAIGTLAGGIAHDFNNILLGISGFAEITRMSLTEGGYSPKEIVKNLEIITQATQRGKDLTQQLLGFARKGKYQSVQFDPCPQIKEISSLLNKGLSSTTHYTIVPVCEIEYDIKADPTQFHQMVNNLVINARDAMPNGGTITIKLEDYVADVEMIKRYNKIPKGGYVKLSVSDEGKGIEEDKLDKIFEPFYTTKGKGTGLGLSQVWGVCKNHNTYIDIETSDKGTSFHIYFPALERRLEGEKVEYENGINDGTAKILLVDDEKMVREFAGRYLTRLGYQVTTAANGVEGLETFRGGGFDLVITDLIMNPMSGIELYDKIRELDPDVNVLLMSGYEKDENVQSLLEKGAAGFISKPFVTSELKSVIERTIRD